VPKNSAIEESAARLLKKLGIEPKTDGPGDRRTVFPTGWPGIKILQARSLDIPLYVWSGKADLGITGQDMVAERRAKVVELLPLDFGKCTLALAARKGVRKPKTVAAVLPNLARRLCRAEGIRARILPFRGTQESAVVSGLADAVFDQVATGRSLDANRLRVIRTLMESRAVLIANGVSLRDERKKQLMDAIVLGMRGAMAAADKAVVVVNAANRETTDALLQVLPAMKSPTVSELADGKGFSLLSVVPSEPRLGLILLMARLKAAGGTDMLVQGLDFVLD
jgi:ATP phosphoribosyltransferase